MIIFVASSLRWLQNAHRCYGNIDVEMIWKCSLSSLWVLDPHHPIKNQIRIVDQAEKFAVLTKQRDILIEMPEN